MCDKNSLGGSDAQGVDTSLAALQPEAGLVRA